MKSLYPMLLAAAFLTTSIPAMAQVVWDESENGPLSSDPTAPTPIELNAGSNLLFGSTIPSPLEPDFVVFTVPPDRELASISLTLYETPQSLSFWGMELGTGISSTSNPDSLLGAVLIGTGAGVGVGDNLIDDLGEAPMGGTGFEEALGAGTYTMWFQETGSPVDYGFDIVLTPEPASNSIFGLGALYSLALFRRKTH